MPYKNSFYNVFFTQDNAIYVYNILSTSLLEINASIENCLKNSLFDTLSKKDIQLLIDEGLIVDDNVNEVEKYEYFYHNIRFVDGAHKLQIMFVPTYGCNLRCPYCYEGQKKSSKTINKKEIDIILSFIEKEIEFNEHSTPIDTIGVSLYGGEPLMCKSALIYFCHSVLGIAKHHNLKTMFDMTSNFVLLDDNILQLIKECDISVQVSIDGPKEEHDIRRITVDKKGTFDTILQNLKRANDFGLKDNITIRINVDEDNVEKIEDVFVEMNKYSNDVYFGILTKYNHFNDGYRCDYLDEDQMAKTFVTKLNSLYAKYSLLYPQRFGKKSPCSLNSSNKWIIDCNLNVYKCEMIINNPNNAVGRLDENGNFIENENYISQMSFSPFKFEKCRKCKLLPLCAAGCPAKTYINKEDPRLRLVDCFNCDYTEESLIVLLKDYVKNNSQ